MSLGRWQRVDLPALPPYQPWKPEALAFARAIDWRAVNHAALQLLVESWPGENLEEAARQPRFDRVRDGIDTLFTPPVTVTPEHIIDGGHRIIAMREQHLQWTVGRLLPA